MDNLFPEDFEEEEEIIEEIEEEIEEEEAATGYYSGYYFDFDTGDYKQTGTNDICIANGVESWEQWCIKCLNTQKDSCEAYPDFGPDYESAFHNTTRDEAESILTRTITEALMADPYKRTVGIESITYEWGVDDLIVNVIVIGIENATIDITAAIDRGGV